jgi:hypothetical protein
MPFNFPQEDNFASGLAKGASGALENFVMPSLQQRQTSKLALQMMNAKMEAEQSARLAEQSHAAQLEQAGQIAAQERSVIPSNEMQEIAKQTGAMMSAASQHQPLPAWDFRQIKSAPGQQTAMRAVQDTAEVLGRSVGVRPIHVTTTDPLGNDVVHLLDPLGQEISHSTVGLSPKAAANLAKADQAHLELNAMADRLESAIGSFQSADSATGSAWQAGKLTLNQLLTSDPHAKAFIDALPQDALSLDKATNGTVRSSPQLSAMTAPAIFSMNDTLPTTALKLKRMRQIAYDNLKSVYQSNGPTPLPSYAVDPNVQAAAAMAPAMTQAQRQADFEKFFATPPRPGTAGNVAKPGVPATPQFAQPGGALEQ